MRKIRNIANVVTASRIIFSVFIMFTDAFSVWFYIWYLSGAFSDMIDGTLGTKLDTVCDCGYF